MNIPKSQAQEQGGISTRLQRLKQSHDKTLPLDWWECENPNKEQK